MWTETTANSVTTWNAQISVPTDDDNDDELQGTITVTLNDPDTSVPNDYTVSSVPSEQNATVTVNDNDAPEISIDEPAPGTQILAGNDIEFTVIASQEPAADLQIRFTPTETDTTYLNTNSITESDNTVRPGGTSGTIRTSRALEFTIVGSGPTYSATLKIATKDNTTPNFTSGSITVRLQADDPANSTYTITTVPGMTNQNDATASISDKPNPIISIVYSGSAIREGQDATFTILADKNPLRDLAINYTPTNNTPTNNSGGDYLKVDTTADPALPASGTMRTETISESDWTDVSVGSDGSKWSANLVIETRDKDGDLDADHGSIIVTLNDPPSARPDDYTVTTVCPMKTLQQ